MNANYEKTAAALAKRHPLLPKPELANARGDREAARADRVTRAKMSPAAAEPAITKVAKGNDGPHSKEAARLKKVATKPVVAEKAAPKAPAKAAPAAKAPAKAKSPEKAPAKTGGAGERYAGKKIAHLVKLTESGIRETSGRYAMLAHVLKCKNTDEALGHTVTTSDGKEVVIHGDNLAGMLKRGHISLA
jgi:hypothetical protein